MGVVDSQQQNRFGKNTVLEQKEWNIYQSTTMIAI